MSGQSWSYWTCFKILVALMILRFLILPLWGPLTWAISLGFVIHDWKEARKRGKQARARMQS